ncbi:DUF998 domain-containing protein [Streptomyces sp. HNM0574]|uniref:DUF998 domain-containing protein n=1 Tax=Streptomyces sp. HNM0574 TaxID=2714954 RepID=UPI00146BEE81|nr:DUF998 domain-containing protein [Streptomyces sp. HNM0574]
MSRSLRTAPAAVPLALGALACSAWVLSPVLGTGLEPVRTWTGELAADGQRYATLFRVTGLLAGLLVLAGAGWGLARVERRPWSAVGWAGLLLSGAAGAAAALLPLSCTPTLDAGCRARESAGLVPAAHAARLVAAPLALAGALVGAAALTAAARRYRIWPAVARGGPAVLLGVLPATAWALAGTAALYAGHGTWALGLGQRLALLGLAVWLLTLAAAVAKDGRGGEGRVRAAGGPGAGG